MRRPVSMLLLAGVAAAAPAAAAVSSAWPSGTAGEQTHPSVRPHAGGPRTRFTLTFTLADAPGHVGVFATAYRIALAPARDRTAARCAPRTPGVVDSGTAGARVRVVLAPRGRRGWCAGRYRVTVLLERGPYCPRPAAGSPPTPCPEFATQDRDVGDTTFRVRSR
jgi:hypothetical protein